MAFPTTGVLDDFNRADENPLAGNWDPNIGMDGWVTNALLSSFAAGGESCSAAYLTQYGPDCEAYATATAAPIGGRIRIFARLSAAASTANGYCVDWSPGTSSMYLYRIDAGVLTQIDDQGSVTFSAGDGIGIFCIGSAISGWHRVGGSWSEIVSATDANYSEVGYLGFGFGISGFYVDDFGGGSFGEGVTFKRLTGPALLTGSAATLYTAPAGTVTRILHIHASNPSAGEVDLNLSIGADAAATRVYDDFPLVADSVDDDFTDYTLTAGETIQGWASSAGTVNLTITGIEEPV